MRIFDPRLKQQGAAAQVDFAPHDGSKPTRCKWVTAKGMNYMMTAGFGKNAERQLNLYDIRGRTDLPLCSIEMDKGGGAMYLTFDHDTGLLVVAGKVR